MNCIAILSRSYYAYFMSNFACNGLLIMDQAGWHKSKALVIPKNIDIWFLPPYSPELNPVERLWKMIKKNTLHNKLYDSLKQLEQAVVEYFDILTQEVLRKLCACSYI
ncbi:MAG: hypothetical protein BWX83_00508 [Candidatus Cloacimonetes bacterium ADurb.Bin117]|nr:MAG: hypothetical protein BWX83_00508 [Candidatus Cloacimonetes bacterium ADurb.Bin117]